MKIIDYFVIIVTVVVAVFGTLIALKNLIETRKRYYKKFLKNRKERTRNGQT